MGARKGAMTAGWERAGQNLKQTTAWFPTLKETRMVGNNKGKEGGE